MQKWIGSAAEIGDGWCYLAEWKRAGEAHLFFGGECCQKNEVLDGSLAGLLPISLLYPFVGLSHFATNSSLLRGNGKCDWASEAGCFSMGAQVLFLKSAEDAYGYE